MNREYSENVMVRDAAGELLEELGWTVVMAQQETFGRDGTFERESARDTLLPKYFHPAMTRLNPWMTEPQIREAAQILERYLSTACSFRLMRRNMLFSVTESPLRYGVGTGPQRNGAPC